MTEERIEQAEQVEATAPREGYPIELIPIAAIDTSSHPRVLSKDDQARIAELARTIELHGQQQPACVFRQDASAYASGGGYVLCFGRRRLEALKLLGRTHILAMVRPPASESEIEQVRAIENLQRQDLGPAEEVWAVRAVIDGLAFEEGIDPAAGVDPEKFDGYGAAAARIGKSEKWVRDRAYLTRLCKGAMDLLAQGRLMLGHAREIAKLGDKADQMAVAELVKVDPGARGQRIYTNDEVRAMVERKRRSLKVVPWVLNEPFARKPACQGCPHNTKSDPVLFDTGEGESGAGECMNAACFEAKTKAADKAKAAAVTKIQKRNLEPTPDVVQSVSPAWMKPAPVQRYVKKELQPSEGKPVKAETSNDAQRRTKALQQYDDAFRKWRHNLSSEIIQACLRGPRRAGLMLLLATDAWCAVPEYYISAYRGEQKPPEPIGAPPALATLINHACRSEPEDLAVLWDAKPVDKHSIDMHSHQLSASQPDLLERLAHGLGLDFNPPPVFESFLPKDLRPGVKPKPAPQAEAPAELEPEGAPVQDQAAEQSNAPDDLVNKHGVFRRFARVVIPTPKAHKTRIELRIAFAAGGTWRSSISVECASGAHSSSPSLSGASYDWADDAINAAAEQAKAWFRDIANRTGDPASHVKAAKAAIKAIEKWEYEWPRGTCAACGCTDDRGCEDGCEWVDDDHILCSACVDQPQLD